MNNIDITLKQHTPIIHFQWEQEKPTLRASELKPKLDKYLLYWLGKEGYSSDTDNYSPLQKENASYNDYIQAGFQISQKLKWNIDDTHYALNYKVRIFCDSSSVLTQEHFPLFWGNMGENVEKKYMVNSNNTTLNIKCCNEKLILLIKEYIAKFFVNHNFGTRQSKGFGSFSVTAIEYNGQSSFKTIKKCPFTRSPHIEINYCNPIQLLEKMEDFYKFLRRGINLFNKRGNKFYLKPLIFDYMKEKMKCNWEKRFIKKNYLSKELNQQMEEKKSTTYPTMKKEDENTEADYYLIRDLFGLESKIEWKAKYNMSISKVCTDIDRYPSPLLFKVLKNDNNTKYYIGILMKDEYIDVFPDLQKATFKIKSSNKTRQEDKLPTIQFPQDITSFKGFWIDFFNYLSDNRDVYIEKIEDLENYNHLTFKTCQANLIEMLEGFEY